MMLIQKFCCPVIFSNVAKRCRQAAVHTLVPILGVKLLRHRNTKIDPTVWHTTASISVRNVLKSSLTIAVCFPINVFM